MTMMNLSETVTDNSNTVEIKPMESVEMMRIRENARRARIKLAKLYDQGIRPVPVDEKAMHKARKNTIELEAEQLVVDVKRDNAGRRQHQKRTTNPKKLRRELVRAVRAFTTAITPA